MAKTKKATPKKSAVKKTVKPAAKSVKATAKKAVKPVAKPKKAVAKKAAKPAVKATVKKAVKPASKKVVKKAAVKPVPKKTVAKKTAKPVVKAKAKNTAKSVKAKKTVVKKAQAVKKTVKPVAKKAAKPVVKATPKKVVKPVVKAAPKKVVKPVAKAITKKVVKPVKAAVKPAKPVSKKADNKVLVKSKSKKTAPVPAKSQSKVKATPSKKVVREELPAKALITIPQKSAEKKEDVKPTLIPQQLRYSDEELKEFKAIIDKKIESARDELSYLKESLENHTDSQEGNKAWNMEEGSDTTEMEYLMNQIARQNKFIRDLELALVRIENKTYGVCRATGKLIDKNRLRIVPHATLSIEAKNSRKGDDIIPAAVSVADAHPGSEGEGFGVDEN